METTWVVVLVMPSMVLLLCSLQSSHDMRRTRASNPLWKASRAIRATKWQAMSHRLGSAARVPHEQAGDATPLSRRHRKIGDDWLSSNLDRIGHSYRGAIAHGISCAPPSIVIHAQRAKRRISPWKASVPSRLPLHRPLWSFLWRMSDTPKSLSKHHLETTSRWSNHVPSATERCQWSCSRYEGTVWPGQRWVCPRRLLPIADEDNGGPIF